MLSIIRLNLDLWIYIIFTIFGAEHRYDFAHLVENWTDKWNCVKCKDILNRSIFLFSNTKWRRFSAIFLNNIMILKMLFCNNLNATSDPCNYRNILGLPVWMNYFCTNRQKIDSFSFIGKIFVQIFIKKNFQKN